MSHVLRRGSSGDDVQEIQESLAALGFTLEADGEFGEITHNAVIAMQTIFGYDIDGAVGPATRKLIQKQRELGWHLETARNNGYPK
jgi:peptidoglycan hydrolase-like protein with peptidoglycan-binding domain